MDNQFNETTSLLDRYLSGQFTAEEERKVEKWLDEEQQEQNEWTALSAEEKNQFLAKLYTDIRQKVQITPVFTMKKRRWTWIAAAALIVVIASVALFKWYERGEETPALTQQPPQPDVAPGKEGAILTLADGRTIVLDSTFGNIANESGVALVNQDGQLVYDVSRLPSDDSRLPSDDSRLPSDDSRLPSPVSRLTYHTMTTPRGRQYQLVLADGTKVWLNAASSITFPTAFAGNQRKVQITGEAYFEVAKDQSKPFYVSVNGMEVQVLGTHFNINSYGDEGSIKTTLLEGSVKVTANNNQQTANSIVLKPGQQAEYLANSSQLTANSSVDLDEVIAWKNGLFSFNKADLPTIMRQAARWYDVDISFEGNIPNNLFSGQIGKDLTLQQFLKVLDETRIHYRIQDKKLVITP